MTRHRLVRHAGMLTIAAAAVALSLSARADMAPAKLFKIVTAKDDVVIGVTEAELHSFGSGGEIDNLAHHLADAGQITVWQFAVKKTSDGDLVQAPLRRVAIFKTDTLRIEPYNPAPLKALPIDTAAQ